MRIRNICLIMIGLLFSGCASEQNDWDIAKSNNNREKYLEFIQKYPDGEHLNEAKQRLEALEYKKIRESDEVSVFEEFLSKYPKGHYTNEAKQRLEALEFEITQKSDDIESYEKFLSKYPKSELSMEARARIESIEWESAKKVDNLQSYKSFQATYPNSKHIAEAQNSIELLTLENWHKAIKDMRITLSTEAQTIAGVRTWRLSAENVWNEPLIENKPKPRETRQSPSKRIVASDGYVFVIAEVVMACGRLSTFQIKIDDGDATLVDFENQTTTPYVQSALLDGPDWTSDVASIIYETNTAHTTRTVTFTYLVPGRTFSGTDEIWLPVSSVKTTVKSQSSVDPETIVETFRFLYPVRKGKLDEARIKLWGKYYRIKDYLSASKDVQVQTETHTRINSSLSNEVLKDINGSKIETVKDNELIQAVKDGDREAVRSLISTNADVVNSLDENGVSALILAADKGNTDVVKLLLDKGASVNTKATAAGVTALHIASQKGHTDVIELLLNKGADVNVKLTTGGVTAFWLASQDGHTEVVKLLLSKGADVDAKATTNATALWIASQNGHQEVVKLLLDKGADVNVISTKGATALLMASMNGHTEVVKLLLDKGADVDIKRTTDGVTALWLASWQGHAEVVKLLLDKGADVNAKATTRGKEYTCLDVAKNNEIKELLEKAADRQLPENGTIHTYSNKERIAPLNIKTGGDKVHYFVKLTDWNTDTLVQTIFIRAGQTVETTVPLGSYRLKYAAGETWLGSDELFGDKTIYSKAEKRFDFTKEGVNVSGYSVELILQIGGNLSTVRIPKSEW